MEELFLKIILISACCGWCYVEKLTKSRQIFDFIPQYYPSDERHPKIREALTCPYCVAGWISVFAVSFYWESWGWWNLGVLDVWIPRVVGYIIIAPCCTMALVGPIIHLNLFYNKINNN